MTGGFLHCSFIIGEFSRCAPGQGTGGLLQGFQEPWLRVFCVVEFFMGGKDLQVI